MTPEAALSEMLSRTHEAMGKPLLHWCLHYETGRYVCGPPMKGSLWAADWSNSTCPDCLSRRPDAAPAKPISPRPVVANLLRDVKQIITQRRQECYGAISITDEQADELSRAITQRFLMEEI